MHTYRFSLRLSLATLLDALLALPGPPQARASAAPIDACPAGQGANTIALPANHQQ